MPQPPTNREFIERKLTSRKHSTKTVYNPANAIYNKLVKFFSGPILQYKAPDIANPRAKDMQKYGFTDIFGTPFKRSDNYLNFNQSIAQQTSAALRLHRYREYDLAEMSPPEVSKALDIYAGEITTYTKQSPILKVICSKDEIKEILTDLFFKSLAIEQNLFGWTRALCKNGDLYVYFDIDPENGITGAKVLPVEEIERLEGEDPSNPNYVQFQWNAQGITFENVEIAHFRILGNDKFFPYGTSVLFAATKIIKQLNLMIDQMMSYRIVRAPERLLFKYDVTGLEPDKVDAFMEKNISNTTRQDAVDQSNGQINKYANMMQINENYHVAVRKGSETSVTPLAGGQFVGDIEDVELLRDQMFTALGIPGSYMSNKNNDGEQTSLAQKSMLFARTILNIQNAIKCEFHKIALVHLITLGYSGDDLFCFDFELNNPSKLAEVQEFEHWKQKFEIGGAAKDQGWSSNRVQKEFWGWSPEEIHRNIYELLGDAKFQMMISNIENQQGADGGNMDFSGLGGGGMDDGTGGIEGLDQMMQGEDPNLEGGEGEFTDIEGGGDSSLLVTPDKNSSTQGEKARRSDAYLTPNAKGKLYSPVQSDGRHSGQRRNNLNGLNARNSVRNTARNTFAGLSTLKSIGRGIFPENVEISADDLLIIEAEEQFQKSQTLLENIKQEKP